MKIQYRELLIECEKGELAEALDALRTMASIAPSAAPNVSRLPSANVGKSGDALLALLRQETGSGTRYSPNGCHAGLSRVEAMRKECEAAGISAEKIAEAMERETSAEGVDLADNGESLTEAGAF